MPSQSDKPEDKNSQQGKEPGPTSLDDMLQELRILLQGAQVLTAFLIILPFNQGFSKIDEVEKWVYLVTFICSVGSLVCFSAPAAQHRLARPLINRVKFKNVATRTAIVGLALASVSLVLATQLVVSSVINSFVSYLVSGIVGLMIVVLWWLFPLMFKQKEV